MAMRRFLHVGCGLDAKGDTTRAFAADDWQEIRLDIESRATPDVSGSLTDLSALADNSLEGLFSRRALELLHRQDVPLALREFHRVLRPDGFAVISCPDLQSVCALVAEGRLAELVGDTASGPIAAIDMLFGYRAAPPAGERLHAHRTGFTKQSLINALREGGFEVAIAQRRGAPFHQLWAIAGKTHMSAETMTDLARQHFPGLSPDTVFSRTPAAA